MNPQLLAAHQSVQPTSQGTVHRHISQADHILRLLQAHGSAWTPAPELAAVSLQYCARLNFLRKRGYAIENRIEWREGKKYGFYRLKQRQNGPAPVQMSHQEGPHAAEPLFPEAPERHRDDG